jgi:hypothetical protein
MVLHHAADPQVLVIDHVVLLDQLASLLVVEVAPLVGALLMRRGEQRDRLAAARAACVRRATRRWQERR